VHLSGPEEPSRQAAMGDLEVILLANQNDEVSGEF